MIVLLVFLLFQPVLLQAVEITINGEKKLTEQEKQLQNICGKKSDNTDKPNHKSFNSDNATVADAPSAVSLLMKGKNGKPDSLCSGVLISSRHVLTAAHCEHEVKNTQYFLDTKLESPRNRSMLQMETISPTDIQVVLGDDCSKESLQCNQNLTGTRQEIEAKRFWLHSNYIRNQSSDIVIIELEQNVNLNGPVIPVCLSTQSLEINQTVHLYSVGTETLYFEERQYQLQHVTTKVADCMSAKFKRIDVSLRIDDFVPELRI